MATFCKRPLSNQLATSKGMSKDLGYIISPSECFTHGWQEANVLDIAIAMAVSVMAMKKF